jgi:hypothetical protein
MKSRSVCGEGLDEAKAARACDALEVAGVVGDEDAARLAAGDGNQDIVAERLADALQVLSLAPDEVGQNCAGSLPGTRRRCDDPSASRVDRQHMAFELALIRGTAGSRNEFLRHDRAHVLERCVEQMKALQRGVCGRISEHVNEDVGVEDVFLHARSLGRLRWREGDAQHGSGTGDQLAPKQHQIESGLTYRLAPEKVAAAQRALGSATATEAIRGGRGVQAVRMQVVAGPSM